MSNIHVLTGRPNRWLIVLHIPVPDINNSVGVSYRTALVNSGRGGTSVLSVGEIPEAPGPGEIAQSELDLIETGEVFEHVESFLLESGGTTNPQLLASLDAFYNLRDGQVLLREQDILRYFGFTRDVP